MQNAQKPPKQEKKKKKIKVNADQQNSEITDGLEALSSPNNPISETGQQ